MKPKFHNLKVKDIRRETEDAVSIAFHIPKELEIDFTYRSGQYLTIKHFLNENEIRRSYSLCSAPDEKEWRIAVKKVLDGQFSTFANEQLKAGDSLEVMTPMGNFTRSIDSNTNKSYVFFASGSGITPIFSLIKNILVSEPNSDVSLFYGNKNFGSIIFREELEDLKNLHMGRFRMIHILSRESLGNTIQKGRIDTDKCEKLIKAFLNGVNIDEVFVCGPEEMILAVKDTMLNYGLSADKIHFELFGTPGANHKKEIELPNEQKIDSNVAIILDGDKYDLALTSDGESILDAAYKAGADLPFACKGGVCCTCKARIIEGTARMDVNYALEKDEVEAGYILTCQAHPTSEKLIVSFDD